MAHIDIVPRSKAYHAFWQYFREARPGREVVVYPPVTDDLLATIVERIRAAGSPEKIVLFGSRARGDAKPTSDIDLLIVEETSLPRHRRDARYFDALVGVFPAKDVMVWTPAEIAEWSQVANAFVTTALREGRVLWNTGRAPRA